MQITIKQLRQTLSLFNLYCVFVNSNIDELEDFVVQIMEADVEKIAEFPNMQEFLLPVDYKNIDNYIVTQVNIYESSKTIAVIVL